MKLGSKKGFALAMALYFVVITGITSIGIYTYAFYVARESAVEGPGSIRGYYMAIAGLRYAAILLKDPTANFNFNNGPVTLSGQAYTDFEDNLGLSGNETLTVTVERLPANTYQITADFNSHGLIAQTQG